MVNLMLIQMQGILIKLFTIDRKVAENRDIVQFELVMPVDKQGEMIPKRQCVSNICQWGL